MVLVVLLILTEMLNVLIKMMLTQIQVIMGLVKLMLTMENMMELMNFMMPDVLNHLWGEVLPIVIDMSVN